MKKAVFFVLMGISVFLLAESGLFSSIFVKENESKKKENYTEKNISVPVDYDTYTPLNYKEQYAMWFPAMDYDDILKNKSEQEFSDIIFKRLSDAKKIGINTVYVHVRSNCDAYYNSSLFPRGEFYSESADYDPLQIMTDKAHSLGLSFHAWINPMRVQTTAQLDEMSSEYQIKKWYDDSEKNGIYIVNSGEMWYLNPAYSEVRNFIASGIFEILENYKVDGIHIDDYFYPTTEKFFDEQAFEQSDESSLEQWRLENATLMVKQIYSTVKSVNPAILFGISPQGNIETDYSSQFADVKKWCSEKGYCDYIVPQLYYGFKNSTCPYEATFDEWSSMTSVPQLIAGVCTYKVGNADKWAGEGINEWITDSDITARQIEYALADENTDGIAVYSYSSTFRRDDIVQSIINVLRPD